MQYLALIHSGESDWAGLSDEERVAVYKRYMDFSQKPEVVDGAELQATSSATTVRRRNGDTTVTDGPYAEVKEALGGFFVIEAETIDDACKVAAEIPAAERGAIEVRPVYVREES
jgi:hypothetical protein